jgi:isopentenyl-diphosphate Delta-isomerase
MAERVAVVDENNRFVRWAERPEIHALRLAHRSVQVLLLDSSDRIVLQKRDRTKLTHPGYWDMSASGHVEESDYPDPSRPDADLDPLYDAVAVRELEEELGVRTALERVAAFGPEPGVHYEHFVLYRGRSDGPFRAQRGEVEQVRAFSRAEYDALLADRAERVTASLQWLVRWVINRGLW